MVDGGGGDEDVLLDGFVLISGQGVDEDVGIERRMRMGRLRKSKLRKKRWIKSHNE